MRVCSHLVVILSGLEVAFDVGDEKIKAMLEEAFVMLFLQSKR